MGPIRRPLRMTTSEGEAADATWWVVVVRESRPTTRRRGETNRIILAVCFAVGFVFERAND